MEGKEKVKIYITSLYNRSTQRFDTYYLSNEDDAYKLADDLHSRCYKCFCCDIDYCEKCTENYKKFDMEYEKCTMCLHIDGTLCKNCSDIDASITEKRKNCVDCAEMTKWYNCERSHININVREIVLDYSNPVLFSDSHNLLLYN